MKMRFYGCSPPSFTTLLAQELGSTAMSCTSTSAMIAIAGKAAGQLQTLETATR